MGLVCYLPESRPRVLPASRWGQGRLPPSPSWPRAGSGWKQPCGGSREQRPAVQPRAVVLICRDFTTCTLCLRVPHVLPRPAWSRTSALLKRQLLRRLGIHQALAETVSLMPGAAQHPPPVLLGAIGGSPHTRPLGEEQQSARPPPGPRDTCPSVTLVCTLPTPGEDEISSVQIRAHPEKGLL